MQKIRGGVKRKLYRLKGRAITQFYSVTNRCPIYITTYLERTCALVLEFDQRFVRYSTQTETVFIDDFSYTPDFTAQTQDGKTVHIDPHANNLIDEEYLERIAKITEYYEQRGHSFLQFSETTLTRQRATNLKMLYDYKALPANSYISLLGELPEDTTLGGLSQFMRQHLESDDPAKARMATLCLLAHRFYWFDDLKPLTDTAPLWRTVR